MVIFNEFYNIIVQYIYGNPETLDCFQTLVATEMATIASFVLLALPVICIFWLVKWIFSTIRSF